MVQSNNNMDTIVESITCPITQMPMTDPVQGNDGQTYERSAIEEWLNEKGVSPQTREPMNIDDLKINASIRFLCDKYHQGEFGATTNCINQRNPKISTENITLDHTICKNENGDKVMMSFNVNAASFPKDLLDGHLPQDIILVIDRSGSMNSPVGAQDENGNNLESGMSIQDIVNHAGKTVVKTLNKDSRLSVIAFDDQIEITFDLMYMTEINQTQALEKINTIQPRNQTNIWGGIEKAIEILDQRSDKARNGAILLLTDGCPNISPARGEVDTLKKLRIKKNFTSPIYTFGFGYNLQRELLYDLAKYGNGATGHISDGGMIATVFCNFTAIVLSTVVMNLQLHIKENSELPQDCVMGDYAHALNEETKFTTYDIGTVQYEQSRDIILNVGSKYCSFEYYYTYKIGGQSHQSDIQTIGSTDISYSPNIEKHILRYTVVESIRQMMIFNRINQNTEAMWKIPLNRVFNELVSTLKSSGNTDPLVLGLIKNLCGDTTAEGQIQLAISDIAYFRKWGEFYIDQLSRAMNQQIKPNFKDPGCPFGGKVFDNLVDKASDIFDSLPAPKPSLVNNKKGGAPRAPVNMAAFNNMYGGCFDSNCTITMANGSQKMLKNCKKGDAIMSIDQNNMSTTAHIVCIFEITISSGVREVVQFDNGLIITPWHPMKHNDSWIFPHTLKAPEMKETQSIITLVLDNHHIGYINGVQCIMLGHGFTEGILKHPYYGTHAIINDLKNNDGWSNGHVKVSDNNIHFNRDENESVTKITYNTMNDSTIIVN